MKRIPACKWRKRYHKYLGAKNETSLRFTPTSPIELLKLLKSMPAKASSGWDNIPQKIIKSSPFNILIALSHIFNMSLKEGVFPDKMKISKVTPIFKERAKTNVENYQIQMLLN